MRQSARYAILSGRRLTGSCRLPHEITGRKLGRQAAKTVPLATPTLPAAPGEWICAGYTGEGMVHAWLCAKAMARMLLGTEGEDRAQHVPTTTSATCCASQRDYNLEGYRDVWWCAQSLAWTLFSQKHASF